MDHLSKTTSTSTSIATSTTVPSEPLARVFNGSTIRIIVVDGEPLFLFPDACSALGIDKRDARRTLDGSASKTCENSGGEIPPSSKPLFCPMPAAK